MDMKRRCGKTSYATEELVCEMATYRFRTKYGLKISDKHKEAHQEFLDEWANMVDRCPKILNYAYSDAYPVHNYTNEHVIKFTKADVAILKNRFAKWQKEQNKLKTAKIVKQREQNIANSQVQATTQTQTVTAEKPKLEKPADHGRMTNHCEVYHPDYGIGILGDVATVKGKTKYSINFGNDTAGSGWYSDKQLHEPNSKWYFGNEAVEKAKAYYDEQKQLEEEKKKKIVAQILNKNKQGKAQQVAPQQKNEIKIGQIVQSKAAGKGKITEIYKDENDIDRVKIQYSSLAITYRLNEVENPDRFTILESTKQKQDTIAKAKTEEVSHMASAAVEKTQETGKVAEPEPVTNPTDTPKETEIAVQTPHKTEQTAHEHTESTAKVVEEIVKEPRKDYHRKLNSQEASITDIVVSNVRNLPADKRQEYGESIKQTSENFVKANNLNPPPPVKTAAKRKVHITIAARDNSKSAEQERTREMDR